MLHSNLEVFGVVNQCSDSYTKIDVLGQQSDLHQASDNAEVIEHALISLAVLLVNFAAVMACMLGADHRKARAMRSFDRFEGEE